MKQAIIYLCFLGSILFFSCQNQIEKPIPNFEKLKVRFNAENVNWSNSAKTKDATYISNLYLEDAVLGIPYQPFIEGKDNIAKKWQSTVEAVDDLGFQTLTLSGTNEVVYETGLAFTHYTVNGDSKIDTSKYVIVWKNVGNDQYKIAVDMFNATKPLKF